MTNSISGSPLLDSDTLIVNRNGVDYHATRREVHPPICDFEELPELKAPWDGHPGGIWHIKNATETVILKEDWQPLLCQAYDANTWADLGKISEVRVGEDIVVLTSDSTPKLFGKNKTANWDFGEYTDVSQVKTFHFLFFECESFNGKLGGNWDTSSLTYMAQVFNGAFAFNQDISGWDVSKVTNMTYAFKKTKAFNQDIGDWDVGNVNDMYEMFDSASAFNQDIGRWNVSKVTKMDYMLMDAKAFNQDLKGWCVSPEPRHPSAFSGSAMPSDGSHDPCWGHCPNGENGTVDPCP